MCLGVHMPWGQTKFQFKLELGLTPNPFVTPNPFAWCLRRGSLSLSIHLPGLRSSVHSRIPFRGKKKDDKKAVGRIPLQTHLVIQCDCGPA